ncbi:metal ABC transporter substrate-binding protein [Erysipelothrix aquatica]|uniref:metal ABC transporter substrate-binding protein n=1 Tax=Erysipelothrix aquatica TaxID=2683714 RepID=UPI0013569048|nr:zinc ABC transporter substrate-binding protein [Erysipelothrix aquatica]
MKKILIIISSMLMLAGCSVAPQRASLNVVTSFYPLADFATRVGGEHVNVYNILPSGADAHSFEPTPKDMQKISEADVFIIHGLGFEAWTDSVLKSSIVKNTSVLTSGMYSEVIEREEIHNDEGETGHESHDHDHDDHDHGPMDPHTWLDPLNALRQVEAIKDTFIALDPVHASDYTDNFEILKKELEDLDNAYRTALGPYKGNTIVVEHEAFGYLAHAYGLEQRGVINGLLSEEPTPRRLQQSIDYIKENNISVLYATPSGSSKTLDVIQKETGSHILELYTLESLTRAQIAEGENYTTIMYKNLDSLKEGLSYGK